MDIDVFDEIRVTELELIVDGDCLSVVERASLDDDSIP